MLVSGTLAWFFLLQVFFYDIFYSIETNSFWAEIGLIMFYGFGAFSAIIGSIISERIDRRKMLLIWIIIGLFTTLILILVKGELFSLISSIFLGISLGLGFPSSMAFLAEKTKIEERGRVAGLVILVTFIVTFFGIGLSFLLNFDVIGAIILLIIVRSMSFLALTFKPELERKLGQKKSWSHIISYKDFPLYLFPWIMFNVAAGLTDWSHIPTTAEYEFVNAIGPILLYVSVAISGFISGLLADRIGRKQPIIFGLVMLGVSYALLGFVFAPESLLFYRITLGVAWGFLLVIYLTIPGDFAFPGSREKFYCLGMIVPLLIYMGLSTTPNLIDIEIPGNLLSPILSIILFLSIIPILRAEDTLPEIKIRSRKQKKHLEEIEKLLRETEDSD